MSHVLRAQAGLSGRPALALGDGSAARRIRVMVHGVARVGVLLMSTVGTALVAVMLFVVGRAHEALPTIVRHRRSAGLLRVRSILARAHATGLRTQRCPVRS